MGNKKIYELHIAYTRNPLFSSAVTSIELVTSSELIRRLYIITRCREDIVGFSIYRVSDKSEISIDEFIDAIEEYSRKAEEKRLEACKRREAIRRSEQSKFRNGPVAHTGRLSFSNFYRMPRLGAVSKANCKSDDRKGIDPEDEFRTPKYNFKTLPEWDDRPRHIDRSWKSSYEVRKQYMKKLDKHCYTVKAFGICEVD